MRIPRLRKPVLLLIFIATAAAALPLLFLSRRYVQITSSSSGEQTIHVSGSKGKGCLKLNARCNVYNGDSCCGNLYCYELPSMGATCVPPGGSEYYQELLTDGWLQEDDDPEE